MMFIHIPFLWFAIVLFSKLRHLFLSEAAAGAVSPVAEESEEVGVCMT